MDNAERTILLVEDEVLIAMAEERQLTAAGYNVITAFSGEDAIEIAVNSETRIDIILMDIDLGRGIDGTQAAMEILKHREIPVLFQSSHTEKDIVENLNNYIKTREELNLTALTSGLEKLQDIDIHYKKKENLLFPYMEKYGFTAPPQVMWGVDDEIRNEIKEAFNKVSSTNKVNDDLVNEINNVVTRVKEMIFKEENIMLPMLTDNLTEDEWKIISEESSEFGYYLIKVPSKWEPEKEYNDTFKDNEEIPSGTISLPTGKFTVEELTTVLNNLPIDITFVDKNDRVKYFSEAKERIFPRARTIIGREVVNCHPPASVHIVEGIVNDFKSGKKDNEDFWINLGGKFILIRYFALRDEKGEYLGTLEVTQNIGPIRELEGEKRLVSLEN